MKAGFACPDERRRGRNKSFHKEDGGKRPRWVRPSVPGRRLRGRGEVTHSEGGRPSPRPALQTRPYLRDGPGPRGGAVVVVDEVRSSLSVLPLLPARGQTLRGQGVGGGRGRLHQCGEGERERESRNEWRDGEAFFFFFLEYETISYLQKLI